MISGVSHGNGFKGALSYVMEKDDAAVLDLRGVMSERTAAVEMRAVAAQSERVQKPVYHRWFRVAEGERLTDEQWLATVDKAEKALGLEGHQRVIVRHTDTDGDHVHVIWNRVDPETGKAVRISHDFPKVEAVCREAEREYGLQVVAGHHSWKQAGAEQAPAARIATPAEQRQEERTGREPFARIVADTGAQAFRDAQSWADLSDRLQRAGLSLQAYRQGLTVTDGTERAGVSAITGNEWTRAKLEKRFGQTWADFQAGQERGASTPAAQPAAPLRQRQERADRERLRQEYRDYCRQFRSSANRQDYRERKDGAWMVEQARRTKEAQARRDDVQRRKALARALCGRGLARTMAYKAIDSRHEKRTRDERAQAKQRWESTKAQLNAAPRPDSRPLDFKAWMNEQARQGSETARREVEWIGGKATRITMQPQPAETPAWIVETAERLGREHAARAQAPADDATAAEWKRLVGDRTADLRERAEARLSEARDHLRAADRQLEAHTKQQPQQPRGLAALVPGAEARYQQARQEWHEEHEGLRKERNGLQTRRDQLEAFLGRGDGYTKVGENLHQRAEREVREAHPDLAKRMDAVRERQEAARRQEVEERRQAKLSLFEKQRTLGDLDQGQGKGRGGRGR